MSDSDNVLACWRVADLPDPKVGSVRGHHCSRCGAEVWVMPANLSLGLRIHCRPCAFRRMAEAGDFTVETAAETRRRKGV